MRHHFLNTPLKLIAYTSTGNEMRSYLNCQESSDLFDANKKTKIIRHLIKWLRIPVNKK